MIKNFPHKTKQCKGTALELSIFLIGEHSRVVNVLVTDHIQFKIGVSWPPRQLALVK